MPQIDKDLLARALVQVLKKKGVAAGGLKHYRARLDDDKYFRLARRNSLVMQAYCKSYTRAHT